MGYKIKYEKISLSEFKNFPEYDYFNNLESEFINLLDIKNRKLKGDIVKKKFEEMVINEYFLNSYRFRFKEEQKSPKNLIIILDLKSEDEFGLILPQYYRHAILGEISSLKIDDSYSEIIQNLVNHKNRYELNMWADYITK